MFKERNLQIKRKPLSDNTNLSVYPDEETIKILPKKAAMDDGEIIYDSICKSHYLVHKSACKNAFESKETATLTRNSDIKKCLRQKEVHIKENCQPLREYSKDFVKCQNRCRQIDTLKKKSLVSRDNRRTVLTRSGRKSSSFIHVKENTLIPTNYDIVTKNIYHSSKAIKNGGRIGTKVMLQQVSQQTLLKYLKVPLVIIKKSETVILNMNRDESSIDEVNSTSVENQKLKPILRNQNKRNYVEISLLETPNNRKESNKCVPVYKRNIEESPQKKLDDLYEFDSDSEQPKVKRRKKLRTSKNDSIPFEKDMKEVMKKIEKKFKVKSRNVRKVKIKREPIIINNPVKTAKSNMSAAQNINFKKVLPDNKNGKNAKETISNKELGYSANLSEKLTNITHKLISKQVDLQAQQSFDTITSVCNESDHDNMFGFDDDCISDTEIPNKNNINIISNIIIKRTNNDNNLTRLENLDESYNDFRRPNANSTMSRLNKSVSASPWRPSLNVSRNPHFLQFKDTFLPYYNQDMVIDSSILQKTLHTPEKLEISSKSCQSSILNFVSKSAGKNHETRQNLSLFDSEDFSPIKSRGQENLVEIQILSNGSPEIYSPVKILDKAKRNILGPKVDNLSNIIINKENAVEKKVPREYDYVNYDIDNCFGFETFCDENEPKQKTQNENEPKKQKKQNVNDQKLKNLNKPLRSASFVSDFKDKSVSEEVDKVAQVTLNELDIPIENNELQVGLFEDLETTSRTVSIRRYERKPAKRRRHPSVDSHSPDLEEQPKRKKKPVRTRKEEREAEEWAAAFNSMCETIDEYRLEIE